MWYSCARVRARVGTYKWLKWPIANDYCGGAVTVVMQYSSWFVASGSSQLRSQLSSSMHYCYVLYAVRTKTCARLQYTLVGCFDGFVCCGLLDPLKARIAPLLCPLLCFWISPGFQFPALP